MFLCLIVLILKPLMKKNEIKFCSLLQTFIDLTFGAGGHTKLILQHAPDANLLVLDRDPEAFKLAKQLAEKQLVLPLLSLLKPESRERNVLMEYQCYYLLMILGIWVG